MKSEKFKTNNLDLAATIQCKCGIEPSLKKINEYYSEYSFPNTTQIKRTAERFLKGKTDINIAAYTVTRMYLKRLQGQKTVHVPIPTVTIKPTMALHNGKKYWFVECGQVKTELWADKEPHLSRLAENRIFRSQSEAMVYLEDKKRQ